MKTASFFTYQEAGRISIARFAPKNAPAGFQVFRALAPTQPMLKMERTQYEKLYFGKILAALDPRATWNRLHELTAGAEPVLLCWERPPFTSSSWCHRRMVAQWFYDRLGEVVEEIVLPGQMTMDI